MDNYEQRRDREIRDKRVCSTEYCCLDLFERPCDCGELKKMLLSVEPCCGPLQRASLADGLRVRGVPAIPLLCVV